MVVDGIIKAGYTASAIMFVKTGIIYFQDYKASVDKEKAGVK